MNQNPELPEDLCSRYEVGAPVIRIISGNGGTTIWTFDTPAAPPRRRDVLATRYVQIIEIVTKK